MSHEQHPTDWKDIETGWDQDLHPNTDGGLQGGVESAPGKTGLTAADIKTLQQGPLRDLTDEQLREIPILPEGSHLRQGATYLDVNDPERHPFTAMGRMVADGRHYYVPKDNIDYTLWNRLIGVTDPRRLDASNEQP